LKRARLARAGGLEGTVMKIVRFDRKLRAVALVAAAIVVERLAAELIGFDASGLGVGGSGLIALWALGHCDTLDGPLVMLARKAVETGSVNLVLPWVRAEDEAEIRTAFAQTQSVRRLGGEARDLAERHFFETLVRVHRASEGAPYTGLKPAGLDLGPAVPAADRALEDGSIDAVVKLVTDAVRKGIHEHFHAAAGRRRFDPNDVAAGRKYVEAYVPYVHYVERLWEAATNEVHGHAPEHGAHVHHVEHAAHAH
jgi:hypothetical protein